MSAFLNILSLVLGLLSWALPVWSIFRRKRRCNPSFISFYSLSCCAVSLLFQLYEIRGRVQINDLSAIMDTIDAVALAGLLLVGISLLLNVVYYISYKRGLAFDNAGPQDH